MHTLHILIFIQQNEFYLISFDTQRCRSEDKRSLAALLSRMVSIIGYSFRNIAPGTSKVFCNNFPWF